MKLVRSISEHGTLSHTPTCLSVIMSIHNSDVEDLASVDIEYHPEGDITITMKKLSTLLKALCFKSEQVKNDICSKLSQPSFKNVASSDMCGTGNRKVPKEFLASNIITLIEIIEDISPMVSGEAPEANLLELAKASTLQASVQPSTSVDAVPIPTSNVDNAIQSYVSSLEEKVETISKELANNTATMNDFMASLQQMQSSMKHRSSAPSSPPPSVRSPAMRPNTQSPASVIECDPYVLYEKNCVEEALKESLTKFVDDHSDDFVPMGNTLTRDTMYFGDYEYKYTGGSHAAKEIPSVINDLLNHLKPKLTDPSAKINSCLITRYIDGSRGIKPHRDDELVIDPESEIITFSLGASRKMQFTNNSGSRTEELDLEDNSALVSSRRAQAFWLHGIKEIDDKHDAIATGIRYSFTFRHLAPKFVNSTVLIGDSNTRFMKFGEGKGTFGVKMPGKRLEAFHVEDIPDPATIGPYRNIVIHTGVNNIKRRDRRSNSSLANELNTKCERILELYPRSRVYISLLLPTKLESINYRAKELNNMFVEIAHSHRNVSVIDHPRSVLCDRSGCLKPDMGRYDRESSSPLHQDVLHLGRVGYRVFAKSIKEGIFGKYKPRSQGQAQNGGPAGGSSQHDSSGSNRAPG